MNVFDKICMGHLNREFYDYFQVEGTVFKRILGKLDSFKH